MNANSYKAYGYLVIFVDLLAFGTCHVRILWLANPSALPPLKMWVAFLAVFIVGLGLIGLRKWAAIYFSAPSLCIGLSVFWSSIEQVSFPWNLAYMLYGVSLMLPAVVTVRLWPYLSWRGKWFF